MKLSKAVIGFFVGALTVGMAHAAHESKMKGSIQVPHESQKSYANLAQISLVEATNKALRNTPGKIISSGLENEDGFLVYAIKISTAQKDVKEVIVDAGNGQILASNDEDQDSE